jgi:sugar lactone lactonase YvrE
MSKLKTSSSLAFVSVVGAGLVVGMAGPQALADSAASGAQGGDLVFSVVDRSSNSVQIFSVGKWGHQLQQLTTASEGAVNECPAWSRSGKRVFYDRFVEGAGSRVYKMRADGNAHKGVGTKSGACPSPSPAGNKIAFVFYGKSGDARIGQMRANGSQRNLLVKSKGATLYSPAYSPDGKWLTYGRIVYGKDSTRKSDIYLMNLASGKKENLTARSRALYGSPSWDPRGNGILATRGSRKIVRLNLHKMSRSLVKKTPAGTWVTSPVYAPDRKRIAYLTCTVDCGDPDLDTGIGTLWTVKRNGQKARQIVEQTTGPNGIQPFGHVSWREHP